MIGENKNFWIILCSISAVLAGLFVANIVMASAKNKEELQARNTWVLVLSVVSLLATLVVLFTNMFGSACSNSIKELADLSFIPILTSVICIFIALGNQDNERNKPLLAINIVIFILILAFFIIFKLYCKYAKTGSIRNRTAAQRARQQEIADYEQRTADEKVIEDMFFYG